MFRTDLSFFLTWSDWSFDAREFISRVSQSINYIFFLQPQCYSKKINIFGLIIWNSNYSNVWILQSVASCLPLIVVNISWRADNPVGFYDRKAFKNNAAMLWNRLTLRDIPVNRDNISQLNRHSKGWPRVWRTYRNWVLGTFRVGILILNSASDPTSQKPVQFVPLSNGFIVMVLVSKLIQPRFSISTRKTQ